MSVKELVETAIAENKIAIFSKTDCIYCMYAKALFEEKYGDVLTKVVELDELNNGNEVQDYLEEKTGQRTVPNIFINQEWIGGNDTVQRIFEEGSLDKIIQG